MLLLLSPTILLAYTFSGATARESVLTLYVTRLQKHELPETSDISVLAGELLTEYNQKARDSELAHAEQEYKLDIFSLLCALSNESWDYSNFCPELEGKETEARQILVEVLTAAYAPPKTSE